MLRGLVKTVFYLLSIHYRLTCFGHKVLLTWRVQLQDNSLSNNHHRNHNGWLYSIIKEQLRDIRARTWDISLWNARARTLWSFQFWFAIMELITNRQTVKPFDCLILGVATAHIRAMSYHTASSASISNYHKIDNKIMIKPRSASRADTLILSYDW